MLVLASQPEIGMWFLLESFMQTLAWLGSVVLIRTDGVVNAYSEDDLYS